MYHNKRWSWRECGWNKNNNDTGSEKW